MTIKLQKSAMIILLSLVYLAWVPSIVFSKSDNAVTKAGHIVMASGRLIARATNGAERRLRRRAAIYAGDTIIVGKNAFVQIRFTDGGLFSLRPNTHFRVNEYRYQSIAEGNGKAVFELLKGGLRTISGAIGKKQQANYQLKTPVSTIGIRGTHYGIRLCAGDCVVPKGEPTPKGLYGGVAKGAISIKNATGEKIFGSERFFHVATKDAPINALLGPPGFVFDPVVSSQEGLGREPRAGNQPPSGNEPPPTAGDEPPPPGDKPQPSGSISPPGGKPSQLGGIPAANNPALIENAIMPLSDFGAADDPMLLADGGLPLDVSMPIGDPLAPPLDPLDGVPFDQQLEPTSVPLDQQPGPTSVPLDQQPGPTSVPLDQQPGSTSVPLDQQPGLTPAPPDQQPEPTPAPLDQQPGLTPAPLWSAAVMAVNHGKYGADAMIAAQKNIQNPEIFIDANNNVMRMVHESPNCLPCEVNRGTATLTSDGMPAGGFTMLNPSEKIYWGRWQGGWSGKDGSQIFTGQGSWHFMYSPNVTTISDLDSLQVSGSTNALFSLIGTGDGTLPTDEMGNTGVISSASMRVNFQTRQISNYQVGVDFGSRLFTGTQQATAVSFIGSGTDFALDVTCSPGCSTGSGLGRSNIVFVGTNASHVMNGFEMHTDDGLNSAVGTLHMTRPMP